MGLFQQRPEQQKNVWAGLPSEPFEPQGVEDLPPASDIDLTGLGPASAIASVGIPVDPAAVEADGADD